jgi:cysteine desulfurase
MRHPVYLDYAATTPLDKDIAERMLPYMTGVFGNPSSLHSFGQEARQAVAKARGQLAALLCAGPQEIFFTSGGSESDNWAIKGIALANQNARKHIITTQIEHHAVLHTCAWLEQQGFRVTYLPVDVEGRVSITALKQALDDDTLLVSIMAANNEVGTIEPIEEIGVLTKEKGVYFHVDAVQAVAHIPLDVRKMQVDALSLSGHKFYGPKGIGALYLRQGVGIVPFMHGGAQERNMRAGTENVPGIIGLGMAAELAAASLAEEMERLSVLRERLIRGVLCIDGAWINGSRVQRLPGNVNFGIQGIESDVLLLRLDMAGFAVSGGSACSAGSLEPSHVLLAMGQDAEKANSAIRVSMGNKTVEQDVDEFLLELQKIVSDIRELKK